MARNTIGCLLIAVVVASTGCPKESKPDPRPEVEAPDQQAEGDSVEPDPELERARELVEAVETGMLDTRDQALQAMAEGPHPTMVPTLLEVLALDVDSSPIRHHAFACEALGNLAQEHPDAITEAAVAGLDAQQCGAIEPYQIGFLKLNERLCEGQTPEFAGVSSLRI